MGAVSGILGLGGGASGTGYAKPQQANIVNATTAGQANTAYSGVQNSLGQQQALLNALQAQNGIQNQSNVYNQLQGVANGTGPNPAQAQLAQATGANTANQAALMASQRGTGANAGLIARQAAQQGAANQQNAAGQAATLQANQSLNALNQLSGIAGQQVNQQVGATSAVTGAQTAEQQALLNAIAAQNNAAVGSQTSVNSGNTALAGATIQGQQGLLGGLTNAAGPALSSIGSSIGNLFASGGAVDQPRVMAAGGYQPVSIDYNNNDDVFSNSPTASGATDMSTVGPQSAPTAPSAPKASPAPATPSSSGYKGQSGFGAFISAKQNPGQATDSQFNFGNPGANKLAAGVSNMISSIFSGGSSAQPQQSSQDYQNNLNNATAAFLGAPGTRDSNNLPTEQATYDFMKNPGTGYQGPDVSTQSTQQMPADNDTGMPMAAKGGKVPAMVSPGERYLPPKEVEKVVKGKKDPMKAGEKIPGKPKVGGAKNDYANDTVPKTLDEGGIVLPRSVTQAKHPHWEAHKFISAIMAKNGGKMPKKG